MHLRVYWIDFYFLMLYLKSIFYKLQFKFPLFYYICRRLNYLFCITNLYVKLARKQMYDRNFRNTESYNKLLFFSYSNKYLIILFVMIFLKCKTNENGGSIFLNFCLFDNFIICLILFYCVRKWLQKCTDMKIKKAHDMYSSFLKSKSKNRTELHSLKVEI